MNSAKKTPGMTMREALRAINHRQKNASKADIFELRKHLFSPHSCVRAFANAQKQTGVTLVETLIGIMILSISFTAIASLLTSSVLNSATPVIREQATAIAESHLEMVLLQAYSDPNQVDTGTCEEGNDSNRVLYDDVNDFSCLVDTDGARDATGALIAGLEGYNVDIDMQATTLHGAPAMEIDVTVTHDGQTDMTVALRGYRVNSP